MDSDIKIRMAAIKEQGKNMAQSADTVDALTANQQFTNEIRHVVVEYLQVPKHPHRLTDIPLASTKARNACFVSCA